LEDKVNCVELGGRSMRFAQIVLVLGLVGTAVVNAGAAEPDEVQAAMEANNTKWLQAYNSQDAAALSSMYAADALLIAAGSQPIHGAKDIEAYWAEDVQGCGDHTWKILETRSASDLAYRSPNGPSQSAAPGHSTPGTRCASSSASRTGSG
jgi:SnoaL-like domain